MDLNFSVIKKELLFKYFLSFFTWKTKCTCRFERKLLKSVCIKICRKTIKGSLKTSFFVLEKIILFQKSVQHFFSVVDQLLKFESEFMKITVKIIERCLEDPIKMTILHTSHLNRERYLLFLLFNNTTCRFVLKILEDKLTSH